MKSFHVAMSVDVDRFDDAYLIEHFNGVLLRDDGSHVQVPDDLRKRCAEARASGLDVFPPCDHTDAKGHCLGHDQ
jgi:hypothetical protein